LDSGFVQFTSDGQSGAGGGRRNELDDNFVADQRFGAPILADKREQAMLDLIPLAGTGGKWLTTISRPISSASFCSSRFHNRTREPLLPPPSAMTSSLVALG
jgi:hypothetical protein